MNERGRDIEDSEEQLDSELPEPLEFWKKKQRELVTSVVDYNLQSITSLLDNKRINTAPEFQRRFRWDTTRQSKLIESFLLNVPVPPIFLNEDDFGEYSIIDGKQRLTAIHEFFRGRLRLTGLQVFQDLNDKTIDDLPQQLRTIVETRPTIRAIIILRQSDRDIKYMVFDRLNTGGVRLNAQEIRNSAFPGALNSLILRLSELPDFHALLHVETKAKSAIWREMRDAELVLRYFTFRENWTTFESGMKRAMDAFMEKHRAPDAHALRTMEEDFLAALVAVEAAFGEYSFRRWVPAKGHWRKQVLASLFDAQMFSCRGRDPNVLRARRETILERLKGLFGNSEFRQSIDAATNTPQLFKRRIEMVRAILS